MYLAGLSSQPSSTTAGKWGINAMRRVFWSIAVAVVIAQSALGVEHLKQSTAVTIKFGPFVDAADGVTAEGSLTLSQADFRLSKNGGDIAQKNDATAGTHDELGFYDVPLDATDTNTLGRLLIAVSETGALPVWKEYMVLPANVYDSLYGSDKLEVDVTTWNGTAVATPDTAGYPKVTIKDGTGTGELNLASGVVDSNVVQVLGEAVDADPATLNVNVTTIEGVDATDTIGTPQSGDNYALLGTPVGASIAADIAASPGAALIAYDSAGGVAKQAAIDDLAVEVAAILDDTGTSGVVVAAGTEIEVADADLRAALGMSAADLDTQLDAIVADTNELQTDWVNGGRLDLILDARSSQSSVDTIDGIVDAILLDTAEIGTAGAGLSAIPWRAAWDAEVQSEVADALAVYDPPTKAEMDSGFAGISITLSPEDIAAIAAAVDIDEASLTSAVWAYNSRTLTAGTNIVLAKGTGVTGFNDLDAAGIRSAVGLASANIDTQFDNISVTLTAQDIEDIIDGINEGIAPPRINMRPDPGFTFQVSRRADGTYKCTRPLRIAPGAVETIHPAIDMSPLFGQFNYVQTVGTPSISGGSLTVAAEGARDTYAILEVDGTASAGEERTITVVVTMTSGASVQVKLDVEVFDE